MTADNPQLSLTRQQMQRFGQAALDMIIDHHDTLADLPVGKASDPQVLSKWLNEEPPEHGSDPLEVLAELNSNALNNTMNINHPRYFAFVPGPSNFASAVGDMLASAYNIFAGAWLGPSGVAAIEIKALNWLKQLFGYPSGSGGLFVSGGSMANLTAIAVARQVKLRGNMTNATIYFSDQTHSSVRKDLAILGFQPYQARIIASDAMGRVDVRALQQKLDDDRSRGMVPFCIVATAGTTNTGAIDPLNELAKFCQGEGLWLHVDAAFGGGAILSSTKRKLLDGIEQADSITIDPHKWMFQPYEIGCLLVRNEQHLSDTFRVQAEYLEIFDHSEATEQQINYCDYGVQLTREFRALKFWLSLKVFGLENFGAAVDRGFMLAKHAQTIIENDPKFWSICTPAQLCTLTFSSNLLDELPAKNAEAILINVVRQIMASGKAMMAPTRLDGKMVLRLCTINPRTNKEDISFVIELLKQTIEQQLSE
ncbi:MAG: aminotransferase class I/II-fold pyridoxal phosphate-dependent enzyme [Robiginitomaculum sp.]|nr:aminotransferase class I/II-fold pyridoxal phosphate-dependent enzyme [Robiginitomaculum sp.]